MGGAVTFHDHPTHTHLETHKSESSTLAYRVRAATLGDWLGEVGVKVVVPAVMRVGEAKGLPPPVKNGGRGGGAVSFGCVLLQRGRGSIGDSWDVCKG